MLKRIFSIAFVVYFLATHAQAQISKGTSLLSIGGSMGGGFSSRTREVNTNLQLSYSHFFKDNLAYKISLGHSLNWGTILIPSNTFSLSAGIEKWYNTGILKDKLYVSVGGGAGASKSFIDNASSSITPYIFANAGLQLRVKERFYIGANILNLNLSKQGQDFSFRSQIKPSITFSFKLK